VARWGGKAGREGAGRQRRRGKGGGIALTPPSPLPPTPLPSQKDLHAARVELASRDHCAHFLIPLNECRRKALYMPWACGDARHAYEKCLYFDYKRRVAKKEAEK